ncbi:MAG: hypothetical protein ABIG37_00420 [Nanoarchaeota archaeon]
MSLNTSLSDCSALDLNCAALFKIAKKNNLELPIPSVHVYLSGLIDLASDSIHQGYISKFVVGSPNKLKEVVDTSVNDKLPYVRPYRVSKYSGDFALTFNSILSTQTDIEFSAYCYSYAGYYSGKLGKKQESEVFGLLALKLDEYYPLLNIFYNHTRENPDFEVTDKDFLDFEKWFKNKHKIKDKKISFPKKIKQKKKNGLLLH